MNERRVRARIRGLYGIADADASGGDPERLSSDLLAGGCRLIQIRCKSWSKHDLLAVTRAIVARARAAGATVIVNDHPDVAAAADADGVHVGQLDAATDEVRRIIGPRRIIGRSTNDLIQLRAAVAGADYLAFGPVWPTENAGRPKTVRDVSAFAEARRVVPPTMPLVAIGGIDAGRLAEVRAAGADAWAVIGAIARATDRIEATRELL